MKNPYIDRAERIGKLTADTLEAAKTEGDVAVAMVPIAQAQVFATLAVAHELAKINDDQRAIFGGVER